MTHRKPRGAWTKDLAWANSVDTRVESLWRATDECYVSFRKARDGTDLQRSGVDRVARYVNPALLPEGCDVTLEEKVRRRAYDRHVLLELEHIHKDGRRRPGWANALPDADWLAWVWLPRVGEDVMVSVSVESLRFFMERLNAKIDRVPRRLFIRSGKNNPGYYTRSVLIPVRTLSKYGCPWTIKRKPGHSEERPG